MWPLAACLNWCQSAGPPRVDPARPKAAIIRVDWVHRHVGRRQLRYGTMLPGPSIHLRTIRHFRGEDVPLPRFRRTRGGPVPGSVRPVRDEDETRRAEELPPQGGG